MLVAELGAGMYVCGSSGDKGGWKRPRGQEAGQNRGRRGHQLASGFRKRGPLRF